MVIQHDPLEVVKSKETAYRWFILNQCNSVAFFNFDFTLSLTFNGMICFNHTVLYTGIPNGVLTFLLFSRLLLFLFLNLNSTIYNATLYKTVLLQNFM